MGARVLVDWGSPVAVKPRESMTVAEEPVGRGSCRGLLSWAVAFCSLAACGPAHAEHPLEARARRVVVACSKELSVSSELHDFSPAICQQHCPKATGRERLLGCFRVIATSSDGLQRMAPGAEALMSCEYTEAQ
jgi:hypothetical protein